VADPAALRAPTPDDAATALVGEHLGAMIRPSTAISSDVRLGHALLALPNEWARSASFDPVCAQADHAAYLRRPGRAPVPRLDVAQPDQGVLGNNRAAS
jgi:hypothetical protein